MSKVRVLKLITTEDGSHSIYVQDMNETYHSFHGAMQESMHVFINSGLQYYSQKIDKSPVHILEIGFGTGLNALLTTKWAENRSSAVVMHSMEAYPVPPEILNDLNYADKLDDTKANKWFGSLHETNWNEEYSITEHFRLKKIEAKIENYNFDKTLYDVVYFDAFAPNKQPEIWELSILEKISDVMQTNSIFVTYCAKGQLKRDLASLNFEVETLSGPPGKKEMIRAIKK